MGLEVLEGDVIVNSPRYSGPSEGMEAIYGRVQLKGGQETGQGGTDHRGRNREQARGGGDKEKGGGGRGFD